MVVIYDRVTGGIVSVVDELYPDELSSISPKYLCMDVSQDLQALIEDYRVDTVTKRLVLDPPRPVKDWDIVRSHRSKLLSISDSMLAAQSLPDLIAAHTPAQMAARNDALLRYRQELRDVTKQPDPTAILWPDPPVL